MTVQLLRVKDGVSLWTGAFDVDFTNILSVQDAISSRVAEAIAAPLTGELEESLAKHHTANHQAYQAYMKGRHFLTLWTEHGFRKAIESFEQAVAADPGYALAYAGLAEAWTLLGYYNFTDPAESFVKAQAAAVKALGIDGDLADAQLAIAGTYIKLGEKEQAFAWLERMYQERQPVLIFLKVEPIYDGLRSAPRFAELLRRLG